MEANEMMYGDLVMYGGHLCRFIISNDSTYLLRLSDGSQYLPIACNDAEPISLTPEILEKNGFDIVQDGDTLTIWKQKDDEYGNEVFDITIYASKNERSFDTSIRYRGAIRKNIYFVHELQHALRLCWMNNLADNFKV